MSNISNIVVGATPSTDNATYWSNGNIPWLPSGCCQDGEVVESYHAMKMISQKGYDSCSTTMMDPGTVLIALTGATAGKVGLLKFRACANQSVVGISTFLELEPKFVFYQLMGRRQEILSDCIGSAQPHISKEYITKMYFALPPYAEQKRIINEIEKIEPLITEYNKLEKQKTKLDSEIYDNLKKSILQYAIQGKLVPQDPNDEPASVLLEKIRAEKKAQLGKKYVESYIYKGDDNCYYEKIGKNEPVKLEDIPFDIPDSWAFSRLGDIIYLQSGRDLEPNQYNASGIGIPYITGASNIKNEQIIINRWTNNPVVVSKKGDLLITCKGTIGTMAYNNVGDIHIARQIMAINSDTIYLEYIRFFLESYVSTLQSNAKSMIPGINRDDILQALIPLPSINEQIRIINKEKNVIIFVKGEN